jgi:hypothetical protein
MPASRRRKPIGAKPISLPLSRESAPLALPDSSDGDGALGLTANVRASAASSISTSILKNVREWWDARRNPGEENMGAGADGVPMEVPSQPMRQLSVPSDKTDGTPMAFVHESTMSTGCEGPEGTTAHPARLPPAFTVKTFAQQTIDRAREQQKSHNEYVAWLCENRQKARPAKTAKAYERVRRWWVVLANPPLLR